jgi:hypothetical protein
LRRFDIGSTWSRESIIELIARHRRKVARTAENGFQRLPGSISAVPTHQ